MASKGRVLIIDDAPEVTPYLVSWLIDNGYHCQIQDVSEKEYAILGRDQFDSIVYSHEFSFLFTRRTF